MEIPWAFLGKPCALPIWRLPQAFTHKPNKRKRKGVATSLSCRFTARPLRARASRLSCLAPLKHVRLSATCASQQRAPLSNVRLSATLPILQLVFSNTPTDSCASSQVLSSSSSTYRLVQDLIPNRLRPLGHKLPPRAPLEYSLVYSSQALYLSSPAPRPLLGALHPCPPIGRTRHPSPCRSSLGKQADEDAHLLRRSARAFWREISPRLHPSLGERDHTVHV